MKDFIIAVDDYNISAYDTKAKSVMRIPDDAERMQEIGRLVQRISEDWPCIIDVEKHFKRYRGRALPKDLSLVSLYRWEDYINNEPSVCSGGFPIGFDLGDEYGNFSTWYGENPPPRAIDRIWEQLEYDPTKPNDNTDKLCRLLTALQTEYEVLRMSGIVPPQPEPFVMDIRLQSDRAKKMFELFPKYVEVREGMKLKWLQGTKADFLCFVEEALEYLHYDEEKDKWSLFEKSFEIYDDRFKPTQLLSYSKKPNVKKHIEENEGLCGKIKMTFTMNFK